MRAVDSEPGTCLDLSHHLWFALLSFKGMSLLPALGDSDNCPPLGSMRTSFLQQPPLLIA